MSDCIEYKEAPSIEFKYSSHGRPGRPGRDGRCEGTVHEVRAQQL
jgi:hypothetical protein